MGLTLRGRGETMHKLLLFLLAQAVAFLINVVPAFMPPTWSVMAAFHVLGKLPVLPLTLTSAATSALGRLLLAVGSAHGSRFMPERDRQNAVALGRWINGHRRWRDVIVFLYCLGPFPSNPLFIAAGVGRIPLLPVTIAFAISRAIANTFWVWTASTVSTNVGGQFTKELTSWRAIAVQIAALVVVVLLFRLPWARILHVQIEATAEAGGDRQAPTADRS